MGQWNQENCEIYFYDQDIGFKTYYTIHSTVYDWLTFAVLLIFKDVSNIGQ